MGITIHYTFISKNPLKINKAIELARKYAEKMGYQPENFEEEGEVEFSWIGLREHDRNYERTKRWLTEKYGKPPLEVENRVSINFINEPIGVIYFCKNYYENDYVDFYYYATIWFYYKELIKKHGWNINGYPAIKRGFIINTGTTESFIIGFWRFHNYYVCDEFTKTQPFTYEEYLPNIKHHIVFCNILEIIKPFMDHSYISDEGDYYDTHDPKKLAENFGANARMIWQMVSELTEISNESFGFTIGGKINIDGKEAKKKFKKYKPEP
jgi:HEPN domain-containing protein